MQPNDAYANPLPRRKRAVSAWSSARPSSTYRGGRPQDIAPRRCDMLKATRLRRGITRRELDREREAVRRWLIDGHVARGFTSAQLHGIAQEMARGL
jgi:hypothetical protein